MADLNKEGVRIQVLIKESTVHGEFNDAIYYSVADYESAKDSDIDIAKSDRVNNWVQTVTDASTRVPVEPTEEELVKMKEEIQRQLDEVQTKLDKKGNPIVEKMIKG